MTEPILAFVYHDEINTPFMAIGHCRYCKGFVVLFYPQGRCALAEDAFFPLPCTACGRTGVFFSSYVITGN